MFRTMIFWRESSGREQLSNPAALVLLGFFLVACAPAVAGRGDDLAARASWSMPTSAASRHQMVQWLEQSQVAPDVMLKVDALWPPESEAPPEQLLPLVTDVAAAVIEQARPLVDLIRGNQRPAKFPSLEFLENEELPEFPRNNLKLALGKWMVEHQLLEEALDVMQGVEPQDVVDPAGLLFYRGVALHRLLKKAECLPTLTRLLENETDLPRRYRTVAKLMEADLAPLKVDTLDEVARMMSDIRRMLALGRAGTRVRTEEDDVVRKLEKMIEEMEQQQQQQQGAAGGQAQPTRPMEDSSPGGGSGPGQVQPKWLGNRSGWGDLPPKEREEALQEITKELPAHFRPVIEEYFRKLARASN